MSLEDSITAWIKGVAAGEDEAAFRLWERYYGRLVALAFQRLRNQPKRVADEEDVALSAFQSFCQRAQEGHFPRLNNRDDLWRVLYTLVVRKSINQSKREQREKRGGGKVAEQFGPPRNGIEQWHDRIQEVVSDTPTPELAAILTEEYKALMDLLGDETLQRVAQLKLEEYGNQEIANQLGCAIRTVERRTKLIRRKWAHLVE